MYVVFVEYMIIEHRKDDYLAYMTKEQNKNPNMELLESADQEGLIVEIWREMNEEGYSSMILERTNVNHPAYCEKLHQMIDHTKNRIRIWRFNQMKLNGS